MWQRKKRKKNNRSAAMPKGRASFEVNRICGLGAKRDFIVYGIGI